MKTVFERFLTETDYDSPNEEYRAALAHHLGIPVEKVYWSEDDYPNEFYTDNKGQYEVVDAETAVANEIDFGGRPSDFMDVNDINKGIGSYFPLIDSNLFAREL